MSHRYLPVVEQMMTASKRLPDLSSARDIDQLAAVLLQSVIPSDEVMRTTVDLIGISTSVHVGAPLREDQQMSAALARVGHLHPAVVSYLQPNDDRSPRRISDVVSNQTWWSSGAYAEAFRSRQSRYQLSLVTRLGATTGVGWVLTRSLTDFSDDDVMTASLLLPQLSVMAELAAARPTEGQQNTLTSREQAVLELIATGLSADAASRRLGITVATVRKHLDHIYRKLDVQDRLTAVLVAARAGYLSRVSLTPVGWSRPTGGRQGSGSPGGLPTQSRA